MPADHGNVDAKWDNIISEVTFFYALKFPRYICMFKILTIRGHF